MQPITYYVQTPAIDALVNEYGDRLELMSREDRLAFLRILVEYLAAPVEVEPARNEYAVQAWWLIGDESDSTLTALVAAIATQLAYPKP